VLSSRAYVIQCNGIGPLGFQKLTALGILLDMCHNLKSGTFKAKIEAAHSRE